MAGILKFLMVVGGTWLVWLLWRLNEAIGNDGVLLIAGIMVGLGCVTCVAVIMWAITDARRDDPPAAAQTQERQAPVIVMLGDSRRYDDTPYSAPAGLIAQPVAASVPAAQKPARFNVVGEKESWVDEW